MCLNNQIKTFSFETIDELKTNISKYSGIKIEDIIFKQIYKLISPVYILPIYQFITGKYIIIL